MTECSMPVIGIHGGLRVDEQAERVLASVLSQVRGRCRTDPKMATGMVRDMITVRLES